MQGGTSKSSASVEALQALRGWGVGSWCPLPTGGGVWGGGCSASPEIFLHYHVEMANFVGILTVNFKFYSMNKTVKIYQNPTVTSEYEANSKIGYHH